MMYSVDQPSENRHCCADLAYAVAAASDSLDAANTLVPAYIVTLLFFTGCLLRIPDIPDYAQWYSYINFIRFSWGALMINQYDDTRPEFLPGINVGPSLSTTVQPLPQQALPPHSIARAVISVSDLVGRWHLLVCNSHTDLQLQKSAAQTGVGMHSCPILPAKPRP